MNLKIEISAMQIGLFLISSVVVFLLLRNANALSTSSIELGSNPIVSSNCTSPYTVPADQILIITDIVAYGTSNSYYGSASIRKDSSSLINLGGLLVNNPASIGSFQTGFKAESNTVVSCSTSYATLSWSGYLARP